MITTATIELNGVKYPFRFGMRFQRNFMNHFDIDLISDYQKKIGLLEKMNTQKAFDALGVFIISAVNAAAKEPVELDVDDVLDAVLNDNTIIETMVAAFVQSQPKQTQKAVGKPKK
jgi:predicted glycosyltransferase involved in capsule biosynthesis